MYEIINKLYSSNLFSQITIIDLIDEETVKLIKIQAQLKDNSRLFVTEFYSGETHKYSYHWQNENHELIIRWDNNPHWNELETFPHHKHIGIEIHSSYVYNIDEILNEMKNYLNEAK